MSLHIADGLLHAGGISSESPAIQIHKLDSYTININLTKIVYTVTIVTKSNNCTFLYCSKKRGKMGLTLDMAIRVVYLELICVSCDVTLLSVVDWRRT